MTTKFDKFKEKFDTNFMKKLTYSVVTDILAIQKKEENKKYN